MTGEPRYSDAFLLELKSRVRVVDLIGRRVSLVKRGQTYWGLCPFHREKTASFSVSEAKGFYHCFGCGAHGDAVDFIMAAEGLGFLDAVARHAAEAGMAPDTESQTLRLAPVVERETPEQARASKARSIEYARENWSAALPAGGTPVETYLQSRGIVRPVPPTLRYAPALRYTFDPDESGKRPAAIMLPAMVAAVQDVRGRVCGVHRTYLRADGRGKASVPKPKKMAGECWGGACRLTPAAEHLMIGEGLETCASVLEIEPERAVWAGLSLGNLCGAGVLTPDRIPHPTKPGVWLPSTEPDMNRPGLVLPPTVKRLTILEDAKGDRATTRRLLLRAVARFERLGLLVTVATPPDGLDFNDLLMEGLAA